MTICFLLALVSWICEYKWHFCFPWRLLRAIRCSFSFLEVPTSGFKSSWGCCPQAVVPVLPPKWERGTGTHQQCVPHLLLSKIEHVSFTRWAAQVEQCCIWKGWKNLSLECFALEAPQQMLLWVIFCWKVLGRMWKQGDHLGSRRQDVARKRHMRTEVYTARGERKHWERLEIVMGWCCYPHSQPANLPVSILVFI